MGRGFIFEVLVKGCMQYCVPIWTFFFDGRRPPSYTACRVAPRIFAAIEPLRERLLLVVVTGAFLFSLSKMLRPRPRCATERERISRILKCSAILVESPLGCDSTKIWAVARDPWGFHDSRLKLVARL